MRLGCIPAKPTPGAGPCLTGIPEAMPLKNSTPPAGMMFVAVSSLQAGSDYADALEARFLARKKLVDGHPGFRRLQLLRGRGTTEYLLVLEWDDIAAFKAYAQSPDFKHAHVELDAGVQATGLRMYDSLVDSARGS